MPDLVQGDEVRHLATHGRDADLEPALGAAVSVTNADHDRPPAPVDTADSVVCAEVVDVAVEGSRMHDAGA